MPNNPWERRRPHDAIYPQCTGEPDVDVDCTGHTLPVEERKRQWRRGILLDTELVEEIGVVEAARTFAEPGVIHDPQCAPVHPLCRACYP